MQAYQTKTSKLRGTNYREVRKKAFLFYDEIVGKSKRKPYVRSAYFKKEKIFLDLFWHHLFEKKNYWDKTRRMKFFQCAIELIQKSHFSPVSKENPNKKSEILYRFAGITKEKEIFFVQIKENRNNHRKWLISVFPAGK
jgi:hypothetical protein